jgi:hypothetical protein
MTKREYREVYLRSDHWRRTRIAALDRADNRCQVCNGADALDVHHRTYERLGAELPGDLTVLCRRCHWLFHHTSTVKQPRDLGRRVLIWLAQVGCLAARADGGRVCFRCPLCRQEMEVRLTSTAVFFVCPAGCDEHEIAEEVFCAGAS